MCVELEIAGKIAIIGASRCSSAAASTPVELETAGKIAIIGSSGAGKSTLAQKLGPMLGLEVYHLDCFFWQPNWRRKSREIRIETLQNLVREERWVIEGTYVNSSELHLIKADTIIYLDIPSFRCCLRIIKRHFESQASPRPDLPKGSSDKLTLPGILKVLFFPLGTRKKLENKLRKFQEKIIRLQSPEEVETFLNQIDPRTDEKIELSPSSMKTKDPVLVR
jgi:shikimate kinase